MKIFCNFVVLIVCTIQSVSGLNLLKTFEHVQHNDVSRDLKLLKPLESAIQEELKDRSQIFINKLLGDQPVHDKNGSCKCSGYTCGCCIHAEVKEIHLNDTVCANFSYLPAPEYGISFELLVDGNVFIHKEISAKNPPAACIDVPHLKELASICLKFYNLSVADKTFSVDMYMHSEKYASPYTDIGCVKIQARLKFVIVEDVDLGCFKIPPGGVITNGYYGDSRRLPGSRSHFGVKGQGQDNADQKLYYKPGRKSIKLN